MTHMVFINKHVSFLGAPPKGSTSSAKGPVPLKRTRSRVRGLGLRV